MYADNDADGFTNVTDGVSSVTGAVFCGDVSPTMSNVLENGPDDIVSCFCCTVSGLENISPL